jgi:hypothetical protein
MGWTDAWEREGDSGICCLSEPGKEEIFQEEAVAIIEEGGWFNDDFRDSGTR